MLDFDLGYEGTGVPPVAVPVLIAFPGKRPKDGPRFTVGWHDGERWIVQHKSFREDMWMRWKTIRVTEANDEPRS